MTNIKNYNFNKLDFKLSNSEYYDFFLNNDAISDVTPISGNTIASFDFSNATAFTPTIISTNEWVDTNTSNFSASTFGLTGLDNGNIFYDKDLDDGEHTALLSALTGTTLIHTSGDTKLSLKQVSGATGGYIYPIEFVTTTGSTGNYVNLRGGFYQGYYKLDGYDYQTLPNRYEKGWTISTWLNKNGTTSGNTLNDTYSGNTGFFYYIGTRAENKFWNIFSGNTASGCTSGSTHFCTDIKETDIEINGVNIGGSGTTLSLPLSPPPYDIELITNQFLIYGRSHGLLCSEEETPDGFGQKLATTYDNSQPYYSRIVRQKQTNFLNQFLIFGRSHGLLCSEEESPDGYGQELAATYSGSSTPILELDKDKDIVDNAIGFRIKDDGSIGYRLLTLSADCQSIEIIEEYSMSGVVTSDQWEHVVIKWVNNDNYNTCDLVNGSPRMGKYKFYLNSFLMFTSKELPEIVPKRLDDLMEKQIGVPYNISIGGGTQGLLESMTFDGQDNDDLGLILEKNFAGTFIGYISDFNLYDKNVSWCQIKDIYNSKQLNFK